MTDILEVQCSSTSRCPWHYFRNSLKMILQESLSLQTSAVSVSKTRRYTQPLLTITVNLSLPVNRKHSFLSSFLFNPGLPTLPPSPFCALKVYVLCPRLCAQLCILVSQTLLASASSTVSVPSLTSAHSGFYLLYGLSDFLFSQSLFLFPTPGVTRPSAFSSSQPVCPILSMDS